MNTAQGHRAAFAIVSIPGDEDRDNIGNIGHSSIFNVTDHLKTCHWIHTFSITDMRNNVYSF
jgi:hypothetical protein